MTVFQDFEGEQYISVKFGQNWCNQLALINLAR